MDRLKLNWKKIPMVRNIWEARAFISLGFYSTDEDGQICLSPECRTASEICHYTDSLIKELEKIKRKANKLKWDNHPSSKR